MVHPGSTSGPLLRALVRVRRSLTFQGWIDSCTTALFIALTAGFAWVVATRFFPVLGDPIPVSGGLLILGVVAGTVFALVRRPTLVSAALEADRRLGLKERLTSSLELLDADNSPMVEALHADACTRLSETDVGAQFPVRATRTMRWLPIPLALFGLAYAFLPEFDLTRYRERVAEAHTRQQTVNVHVERIKESVDSVADTTSPDAAPLEGLTAAIEALGDELSAGAITEKQVLARLSDLAEALASREAALSSQSAMPRLAGDASKFGMARELAAAIQEGRMADAARKVQELQQKLQDGSLSEEQLDRLQNDLATLAKSLEGQDSALAEALAKAAAGAKMGMETGDFKSARAALDEMQMSLEDMQSVLDQLEQMNVAMAEMQEWQQELLGPSDYCRYCGAKLQECDSETGECDADGHTHDGVCASCKNGLGMRGAGQGRGGSVGPLPEVDGTFKPTRAAGALTKGKMLADIIQRTAPEGGEEPSVETVSGAFVELKQEAEHALTQEEIPPASKEFVRQYFGSLEPDSP